MRTIAAAACAILILGSGACDFNDPDEIQNQANLALVRVQFFASSTSRTPVPGVRMIVEAPQQQQGGGGQAESHHDSQVLPVAADPSGPRLAGSTDPSVRWICCATVCPVAQVD